MEPRAPAEILENDSLRVAVLPSVGGRISSLVHKPSGREVVWSVPDAVAKRHPPGSDYDAAFAGGIDELLPNDPAEAFDGRQLFDHGELWTAALKAEFHHKALVLSASLPGCGLDYVRQMTLTPEGLVSAYRLTNRGTRPLRFLWKLHAALLIEEGDRVVCPAATAEVGDAAYSRQGGRAPFAWPGADRIPAPDGTGEFLFLGPLSRGEMALERPRAGLRVGYSFDPQVFPWAWYFASYGAFQGHYTAILEPCTAKPLLLADASRAGTLAVLEAGRTLETQVILSVTGV